VRARVCVCALPFSQKICRFEQIYLGENITSEFDFILFINEYCPYNSLNFSLLIFSVLYYREKDMDYL
jgi:hypothetical protein